MYKLLCFPPLLIQAIQTRVMIFFPAMLGAFIPARNTKEHCSKYRKITPLRKDTKWTFNEITGLSSLYTFQDEKSR